MDPPSVRSAGVIRKLPQVLAVSTNGVPLILQVMLVVSWLLWMSCCSPAVGGPAQHVTLLEGSNPLVRDDERSSSFRRLPVFWHSHKPLVAKELLRPAPRRSSLPAELGSLLFPQAQRHLSTARGPRARPVQVWCSMNEVLVLVDRFQLRAWPLPSLFSLGSCQPTAVSPNFLFFHYRLTDCDSTSQVVGGQLVYTYSLDYSPPPQGHIVRVLPFRLPIHCYYNRFHYSYKVGYTPQVQHTTFMKTIRSQLGFRLTVCTAEWEPIMTGHSVVLGEPVYFVAETGTLLPGERLYVDSCHVTNSKDPKSTPRVDIITNHGCMTDSLRVESSSHFWSRKANMLKFSIDAFLFRELSQVLHLHCSMSVGVTTSQTAKSCNYNQATGRWEDLEAPPSICSCCDSACGDLQDPVKNMVTSPGWLTRRNREGRPSMKTISFPSEEEAAWIDQEGKRKHKDTSPLETNTDHKKTEETILDLGKEARPRLFMGEFSEVAKQVRVDLGPPDDQQPQQTLDQSVSEATNASMNVSASFDAPLAPHNSTFLGHLGSAMTTNATPEVELCFSGVNSSCPPTNDTLQRERGRNATESHSPGSVESPLAFNTLDNVHFQSADGLLDDLSSEGLDRVEHMLQSLLIRGLELDQFAQFRGPMCVEGKCDSGVEDVKALRHGQFAAVVKKNAARQDRVVSEEVLDER
uniref:uncharacterized protein LOC131105372 n=1 Tax=Doryrhamphus excisus TaxID=161450 RepID=UPI0025AEC504|nr:uncharacterized protein LOC131105372 [Doryrhamphus excisus]